MRKLFAFFVPLLIILLTGLLIQAYSSSFYKEPVLVVEDVQVIDQTQQITGTFINRSAERVVVEEVYYENESLSSLYQAGDQLIVKQSGTEWQVQSLKRDGYVFMLIGLFVWVVVVISGKKGLCALLGMLLNGVLLVVVLWINQQNRSFSLPVLMAGYTTAAVVVAMGTSYGFKKLDARKVVGTLVSVFLAFLICLVAMNALGDSGLRYEEMQFITRPYRSVFLSGLLIGAVGASMDCMVMIVASLDELKAKNPQLTTKELLQSGHTIAQDTAPSMVNVLMFAYLSGAVPAFVFYIANGWQFATTFSMHLSLEVLRTLCGGFAIVLSVPIGLGIFALFDSRNQKRGVKE